MFRTLIRNLSLSKNVANELSKERSFSAAISVEPEKDGLFNFFVTGFLSIDGLIWFFILEYNIVKILGTIATNVRTLPNGAKSLIVRTTESDNV